MNNLIYEIQKQQLLQSPYKDAKGAIIKINVQKQFRLNGLPDLLKDKIFKQKESTDTLLLLEDFDEICYNCSSQRLQVLYRDTVYFIEREIVGDRAKYEVKSEKLDLTSKDVYGHQFKYFELIEVKRKINSHQDWLNNPLNYGADGCADGNHTLLTVIYPDKKMEALYVRCWWPEKERVQFKNK